MIRAGSAAGGETSLYVFMADAAFMFGLEAWHGATAYYDYCRGRRRRTRRRCGKSHYASWKNCPARTSGLIRIAGGKPASGRRSTRRCPPSPNWRVSCGRGNNVLFVGAVHLQERDVSKSPSPSAILFRVIEIAAMENHLIFRINPPAAGPKRRCRTSFVPAQWPACAGR